MYIGINNRKTTRSYMLTSGEILKPYIVVQTKNSSTTERGTLPLTTNTTRGLHLSVQLGSTTYRPLEGHSVSASDTYYTSYEQSEGLSSTTALTRESTSGESYLTRSSTSGYGTKTVNTKPTVQSAYRTTFTGTQMTPSGNYTISGYMTRTSSYSEIEYTIGGQVRDYCTVTYISGYSIKDNNGANKTTGNARATAQPYQTPPTCFISKQVYVATATVYTITETITTATLTRSSTSGTSYLTCSSTSGYSGVSSSSSSSAEWN